jgi:tRNA A37 threonylcarbamoyladenosine modification protein TsaB
VIDARMSECYVAHYEVVNQALGQKLVQTKAPQLMAYGAVANLAVDCVIGNANAVLPQWASLAASVLDALPSAEGVLSQIASEPAAKAVLAEFLQPLYVRNQVALTASERAAGQVL